MPDRASQRFSWRVARRFSCRRRRNGTSIDPGGHAACQSRIECAAKVAAHCRIEDEGLLMTTKEWARVPRIAVALLALAIFADATAYDGPVEKKVFTLPSYTTVEGKMLNNVRVGYETYGKLNERGDNAIFIPHFFTGTSHA